MAPYYYLVGVIIWTWGWLGLVVLCGWRPFEFPGAVLMLIGGLGPLTVATMLVGLGYRDPARDTGAGAFLRRALDPRTLGLRWYGLILLLVLVLALGPLLFDAEARGGPWATGPMSFLLIGLLFGALEEPGWRGYAQEGLQRKLPLLLAALIIALFWAGWHLPLFLIPGTYQYQLGLGSAAFWAFQVALVPGSIIYAWLYNVTGRVIFAPLLFHGLGNVARELAPDTAVGPAVWVEVLMVLAVLLLSWRWMLQPHRVNQ
ncbi:MAG: CPBP family intramembrane glutamic endopeptidase [Pseudomonadales bacterium]